MKRSLLLAALAAACQLSAAAAAEAPVATVSLDDAIDALQGHVEARTLTKMQQVVERDVESLTHGLLRREAARVVESMERGAEASVFAPVRS
jgi:Skp family chaperone for outer membrane proteins